MKRSKFWNAARSKRFCFTVTLHQLLTAHIMYNLIVSSCTCLSANITKGFCELLLSALLLYVFCTFESGRMYRSLKGESRSSRQYSSTNCTRKNCTAQESRKMNRLVREMLAIFKCTLQPNTRQLRALKFTRTTVVSSASICQNSSSPPVTSLFAFESLPSNKVQKKNFPHFFVLYCLWFEFFLLLPVVKTQ